MALSVSVPWCKSSRRPVSRSILTLCSTTQQKATKMARPFASEVWTMRPIIALIAGQPRYYVNDTWLRQHCQRFSPICSAHGFWIPCATGCYAWGWLTVSVSIWQPQLRGKIMVLISMAASLMPSGRIPYSPTVRLIAEPWDIGPGGYRLGGFPPEFSEWNDSYRDTTRRYWKGDPQTTPDLASRLLGSADKFDRAGRRAWSSVNFISRP